MYDWRREGLLMHNGWIDDDDKDEQYTFKMITFFIHM